MREKPIPKFRTDKAADAFVERVDLTQYDLSQFKPVRFEFQKKSAQLNMRLPQPLLDAVKACAEMRGIPYTRLIREALEEAVTPQK